MAKGGAERTARVYNIMIIDLSSIDPYRLMLITGFFTGLGSTLGSILGHIITKWYNKKANRILRRHAKHIYIVRLYKAIKKSIRRIL